MFLYGKGGCPETDHEQLRVIPSLFHIPSRGAGLREGMDVFFISVYFQPKVFLILFLIFVSELPEHSRVK